ncbi:MAG: hypothetical protein OEY34_10830, partial [Cyclobacteriaceae bacterium]|nr:hypothetical protein [Cyclobacteriaceae bacterium]
MNRIELYTERSEAFFKEYKVADRKFKLVATLRILAFIALLVIIVFMANQRSNEGILAAIIIAPILFGLIIKYHNKISYLRNTLLFKTEINKEEVLRLQNNLTSFDSGKEFFDEMHPYLYDMDIVGKHSLFQLLNRTSTRQGRAQLFSMLSSPDTVSEIKQRQEAVMELGKDIDWIQNFQAMGRHVNQSKKYKEELDAWLKEKGRLWKGKYAGIIAILTSSALLIFGLGWIFYSIPIGFFLLSLLIAGMVLKQNAKVAERIYEQTYDGLKEIMVIKNLILAIQNKTFVSEKLLFLQAPFSGQGVNASHRLAKLSGLLEYFHARANAFYHVFNLFFFLDIHLIRALETWKSKNADYVSEWFDKVSEMEAINSLAGFHHGNPSYHFPTIVEEGHFFEATALG